MKYDNITFGEQKLRIKLMLNMMNLKIEEISLEIPMIILNKQDEIDYTFLITRSLSVPRVTRGQFMGNPWVTLLKFNFF